MENHHGSNRRFNTRYFCTVCVCKIGAEPRTKKMDDEHKKKMEAEQEQRIVAARLRSQFENARTK